MLMNWANIFGNIFENISVNSWRWESRNIKAVIYLSLDENLHNYFLPSLPSFLMIDYCNQTRSVQGLACPMLIHEIDLSRLWFINLFIFQYYKTIYSRNRGYSAAFYWWYCCSSSGSSFGKSFAASATSVILGSMMVLYGTKPLTPAV